MKKWERNYQVGRFRARRIRAADLGYSRSWLKTRLRRAGYKIPRDWFGPWGCVFSGKNRMYRVRIENGVAVIDISCHRSDFDRWANSCDRTIPLKEFLESLK